MIRYPILAGMNVWMSVAWVFLILHGESAQALLDAEVSSRARRAFQAIGGLGQMRVLSQEQQPPVTVYRLDAPPDLDQDIDYATVYHDGYIVPINGQIFRTLPTEYTRSPRLRNRTVQLNAGSQTLGIWEEGIVGQVHCESDGVPYRILIFERPAETLLGLKVTDGQVSKSVSASLGRAPEGIRLLEIGYRNYIWQVHAEPEEYFLEAQSGALLTTNQFGKAARDIWTKARVCPTDSAGASSGFSLVDVAREQYMYQTQKPEHCFPTCISMAFDFFGARISHEDVADVSNAPDTPGNALDASRAAMFSHNSNPKVGWCWHDRPCPLTYGYNERAYGYSAVFGNFHEDDALSCLQELSREHVPIIANVKPTDSEGHMVIVWGYMSLSSNENYVSVFDPNNYINPDTHIVAHDFWLWEHASEEPTRRHDFRYYWEMKNFFAMLTTPLPVTLNLQHEALNNTLTISATVRTCWQYPEADSVNSSWSGVNLGTLLSGSPSASTPINVSIDYPGTLTPPLGANPYSFSPATPETSASTMWVFSASEPELFGAQFRVTFTGWARNYSSSNYTDQTDELGGETGFVLDQKLFCIRDVAGNIVAAIGDEGNLYLADSLSEFEDALAQDPQSREIHIRDPQGKILCQFTDEGKCLLTGMLHGNMNDLSDSCTGAMTDTSGYVSTEAGTFRITDYTRLPPDPSSSSFFIRVDEEVMQVIDSGPELESLGDRDYLSVYRAQEGTTASPHLMGTEVWLYATGNLRTAMDSSQSTLTLEIGDGAKFPSAFLLARQFPIDIEGESLLVTGVSGDTFVVKRGWRGTTAMSHGIGTEIALLSEQVYSENYFLNTPPTVSSFQIRNASQEVVAYIDTNGHLRHRGLMFEHFDSWALWDF